MSIKSKNTYKISVVAFIDILGFKEMIKKSEKDTNEYERVWNALRVIKRWKKDHRSRHTETTSISIFSDSIVISSSSEPIMNTLKYVIEDVMYLQENLLQYEILCRGGVSVGNLYHSKNKMFGPAFLEAYRLESIEAKYPRVILLKNTIDKIKDIDRNDQVWPMFADIKNNYLREDKENPDIMYIDYLHKYISNRNQHIDNFINHELQNQKDEK